MTLTGEVQLRSTRGHTPGHMSVWIGQRCVITGDVLHHPIQCRHPEWTARGDADPDAARATNALVLGTHFTGTAAGHILSTDQGYRFVPLPKHQATGPPRQSHVNVLSV
jgi:glyoxylase-like metal-dependent hydrolase (beta-lactamase superfamily II)